MFSICVCLFNTLVRMSFPQTCTTGTEVQCFAGIRDPKAVRLDCSLKSFLPVPSEMGLMIIVFYQIII